MKAKQWGIRYCIALVLSALAGVTLWLPMILGVQVAALMLTRRQEMDLTYWLAVAACWCVVFTLWAVEKICDRMVKAIDKRAKAVDKKAQETDKVEENAGT